MSILFLTESRGVEPTWLSHHLRLASRTTVETLHWGAVSGAVARVDAMAYWGPASDRESGISVALVGRVALSRSDWRKAHHNRFQGGLACRRILLEWKEKQGAIAGWLNGAYCVAIFDRDAGKVHIVTDRMGFIPVFAPTVGCIRVCSHPDILAASMVRDGRAVGIDHTTIAEFLSTGSGVFPYTYYQNIIQLDAGSHYTWTLKGGATGFDQEAYWKPEAGAPPDDDDAMAEDLAAKLKHAVQTRTYSFLGKTGVFLSGGADSRMLLFAHRHPDRVACMTFYDHPNAELKTAEQLAGIAHAQHHRWQRDFDYYGRTGEEIVRLSGGMWALSDGHYLGFRDRIDALDLGTILSGCYADYLFKGLALDRRYVRLFGKPLPVYKLANFRYDFYQHHVCLSQTWQSKVMDRLEQRFAGFQIGKPPENLLTLESKRLRPLSREADASGRSVLWRIAPFDSVFSDTEVLNIYCRLSATQKLNGIVFEQAVARIVGEKGRAVKNNNYGSQLGASRSQRSAAFLIHVAQRKARRFFKTSQPNPGISTTGSWPNWSYYVAHSEVIAALWHRASRAEREFFSDLIGRNPWHLTLAAWAEQDTLFFLRILTALIWLSQTPPYEIPDRVLSRFNRLSEARRH